MSAVKTYFVGLAGAIRQKQRIAQPNSGHTSEKTHLSLQILLLQGVDAIIRLRYVVKDNKIHVLYPRRMSSPVGRIWRQLLRNERCPKALHRLGREATGLT